jgi:hypothetical protein
MKVDEYWARIVKPLIGRFELEPTSIDLAFAACIAVYHVKDYLPLQPDIKNSWLINDNDNFSIIFAVASAAKHLEAQDVRHSALVGLRADSADIGKSAAFTDGTYFSDGTSWSDMPNVVRVRKPDGTPIDVLWLVKTVSATIELKLLTLALSKN